MENIGLILGAIGGFIAFLLTIIGWFLVRLIEQQDEAHESTATQFAALLGKFDMLNSTMQEHKTDVGVMKVLVDEHSEKLRNMNHVYDRLRQVESDVVAIKTARVQTCS